MYFKILGLVALGSPLTIANGFSAPGRSAVITQHSDDDKQIPRAAAFTFVEEELMNTMMSDNSIGAMIKDSLRSAMAELLSSVSDAAKETCTNIASSVKKTLTKSPGEIEHTMDSVLDELDFGSFSELSSKSMTRAEYISMLQENGLWDVMKEKAGHAWKSVKKHSKSFMSKLSDKMKPVMAKVIHDILPGVEKKASSLLHEACNLADNKLERLHRGLDSDDSSDSDDF